LNAINRYLKEHNDDPKPFVWTKSADSILAKTNRPLHLLRPNFRSAFEDMLFLQCVIRGKSV
jgi:hypothetical protein